ncbi:MAG: hypothetical protein IJY08_06035 [Clostridia bacterium]|nr:hypothetical protein [Clostridia bacterium]
MKNIWKVLLALAIVVCMTFTMLACGDDDIENNGTEAGGNTESQVDQSGDDTNMKDGGKNTEGSYGELITPDN